MKPVSYNYDNFPPKSLDWQALIPLIGPANAAIAKYEGVMQTIPNPDVLLSPLTLQEAVLSSRIEGTQATLGEVLEYEAKKSKDESTAKNADIKEVQNYRKAIKTGKSLMDELPLSLRFIKRLHQILMQGVRGKNKSPGEFRKIPNWIGRPGCGIQEAQYIPCSVDNLDSALRRWESFLHAEFPDKLVQLAILHAEFEAIHPFLDGNGRLGRLLIPLFLYDKQILQSPNFYISEYLEKHRDEYYDKLLEVSKTNNWTDWITFFLEAIIHQAQTNQSKAITIIKLYNEKKEWIVQKTHSQYAVPALDWFFTMPIFQSSDFIANVNIPDSTAKRILKVVKESGLLKELSPAKGRKPAIYAFWELLNIAEGKDVF